MSGPVSERPFDDIHLGWQGKTFTILADRVMGAIKKAEDHYTLAELQMDAQRGGLRLGRLAAAYVAVLRYAGATGVTEVQMYAELFGEDAQKHVVEAVAMLLGMMIPRNVKLAIAKGGEAGEGNRRARRAAASSSKRRSS